MTRTFSHSLCHCTNLRRAARAATRIYDEYVRTSGLSIAQVALISVALDNPERPSGELGRLLGLDKFTLGRNLRPLLEGQMISIARGTTDRRTRTIRVTDTGMKAFEKASALWERAEAEFVKLVGAERSAVANGVSIHVASNLSNHTLVRGGDVSDI